MIEDELIRRMLPTGIAHVISKNGVPCNSRPYLTSEIHNPVEQA